MQPRTVTSPCKCRVGNNVVIGQDGKKIHYREVIIVLVMSKKCETVDAYAEIYDDCCIPDTQGILDRCAEIALPVLLKRQTKQKDSA